MQIVVGLLFWPSPPGSLASPQTVYTGLAHCQHMTLLSPGIEQSEPAAKWDQEQIVTEVPAPNYTFFSEAERYVPVIQADGGQLSGESTARGWGTAER